jgi:hypothetical protein
MGTVGQLREERPEGLQLGVVGPTPTWGLAPRGFCLAGRSARIVADRLLGAAVWGAARPAPHATARTQAIHDHHALVRQEWRGLTASDDVP